MLRDGEDFLDPQKQLISDWRLFGSGEDTGDGIDPVVAVFDITNEKQLPKAAKEATEQGLPVMSWSQYPKWKKKPS